MKTLATSDIRTGAIRVETESFYVPDRSDPAAQSYFFGYRIRITNEGGEPCQLLERKWLITDGLGRIEHVQGQGVIGKQPRFGPGDTFEYTSACPLETHWGTMEGAFTFVDGHGELFDADVGPFLLFVPYILS